MGFAFSIKGEAHFHKKKKGEKDGRDQGAR